MRTVPITYFVLFTAILIVVAPVSATYVLSNVSLSPDGPLVPGAHQQVIASYTLLPSGSTTFVSGHNLQLLTNLTGAMWDIQVIVDGRNAARQTGSGKVVFVNGEILSYPTTRDVSFAVTIRGEVPGDAVGQVMVLHVGEVDNTGGIVPGSAVISTSRLQGNLQKGRRPYRRQTRYPRFRSTCVATPDEVSGIHVLCLCLCTYHRTCIASGRGR